MEKIFSSVKISYVGAFFIFVSILNGSMTYLMNAHINRLNALLHRDCPLPEAVCPFKAAIPSEAMMLYVLSALILIAGVYMIIAERGEMVFDKTKKIEIKKISESLEGKEKAVYGLIADADGVMFQSDLVEKSGLSKVKVTRLLDKLEGKGLVERKRRGMSNVVVLK